MKNKKRFKYLGVICIAFILARLLTVDTGSGILMLIFGLPITVAITSFIYGYKEQIVDYLYVVLVGFLFLPVVLSMNDSAIFYVFEFMFSALIFSAAGKFIKKMINKFDKKKK